MGVDGTVPTPEVSTRRRDNRVHATEISLPAAQPVQSARASAPASGRGRRFAPWLLVSIAALVIGGAITAGALSLGARDDAPLTASGVEALPGRDAMSTQCVPRALSEDSGQNDRCSAPADRDEVSQKSPAGPAIESVDEEKADPGAGTPVNPSAPDMATPGVSAPSDPPAAAPTPRAPGAPAPAAPAPPAPAAPAPAAQPLVFTGISENHVIGLLDIRILSSYTLSLSGQPGSTASVAYGGSRAGSVTFDSGGRASITLGGALISAGLGDPIIRVAYADGTAGSEIQSRRDSI